MTDIHKISVQIARPRSNYEGRVESGFYKVEDGTVTLVEENGVPVDSYKLVRKLKPGEDVKGVACALLRQRYSHSSGGAFNRTLVYPTLKY